MHRKDRLLPVPNDAAGRLRCPFCEATLFEPLDGGGTLLEVRNNAGAFEVREPYGGTTYVHVWRSAPRVLVCQGECKQRPADQWTAFDTTDDGQVNADLLLDSGPQPGESAGT